MDWDKFKNANFERRTAAVKVPSLSAFKGDDSETCEIDVQGLTGEEVAQARERVKKNATLSTLVEKIIGEDLPDAVEAIKTKLGLTEDLPGDAVYRIAVLGFGLVGQPLDQPACVKFFNAHPEAFYLLTSKILELTGLGHSLGE